MRRANMQRQEAQSPEPENEDYYLERLCDELGHPNEVRRAGARAAISWLSLLVSRRRADCEHAARDSGGTLAARRGELDLIERFLEREETRETADDRDDRDDGCARRVNN